RSEAEHVDLGLSEHFLCRERYARDLAVILEHLQTSRRDDDLGRPFFTITALATVVVTATVDVVVAYSAPCAEHASRYLVRGCISRRRGQRADERDGREQFLQSVHFNSPIFGGIAVQAHRKVAARRAWAAISCLPYP